MTRVARVVVLVGIWLALWGEATPANLASGVFVAVVVVAGFDRERRGEVIVRPIAAARFGLYFLGQLLVSGLVVARTVIAPAHRVHTGVVAVPLVGCSDAVVTLVADAVSLTPGTLTIEVRRAPPMLFVHALDVKEVDQVRAQIRRLEVLAVRAFGSDEALDQLEVDDSRSWRGR